MLGDISKGDIVAMRFQRDFANYQKINKFSLSVRLACCSHAHTNISRLFSPFLQMSTMPYFVYLSFLTFSIEMLATIMAQLLCFSYSSNTYGTALISTITGSAAKSTVSHLIQQKLILGYHKDLAWELSYFCFI